MATDPSQNPYNIRSGKKKNGMDNAVIGLLAGLVFPLIGIVILYFLWSTSGSFSSYMQTFFHLDSPSEMNVASKVISLAMITNLIPFYLFLNKKFYQTVRGILISMILFVLLVVLYRFVWS